VGTTFGRAALAGTALAMAATATAVACGGDDDAGSGRNDGAVKVVASFYPLAEAAQQVGGDRVEVTNLTPAGVEPHDLEIDPDQVDAILDADVVLYLGEDFQPAVADIAGDQDGAIDLLADLDLDEASAGDGDGHDEGAVDPHFWLDPTLMSEAVGQIEAALADVSPDDADTFAANAAGYEDELTVLDDEMAAGLTGCDSDQIVTSHAAFHYLAERYDLAQVAVAGLSPEAEPDPDRLGELADLIDDEGITTVFYETLVTPDVAETLAREADVDTAVLNPLEGLSDDEVDAGADYLSVMRDNLGALSAALGCP
jgi:zinc transport system substrate-binding protein